jgi:hypothetical protein
MRNPVIFFLLVIVPAFAAIIAYTHLDSYRVMLAYVVYGVGQVLFTVALFVYDLLLEPAPPVRAQVMRVGNLMYLPSGRLDVEMPEEDLERTWRLPQISSPTLQ